MKKENKKTASEEIKIIAKQLIIKDSEAEFIGATPNYLANIAMKKAKLIYETFKCIDEYEDLDKSK
jgi:hypothetical protein